MKLSKRLQTIADWVPHGAVVADVGSDHGLLPEFLIRNGIAKRVYGIEVNPGPQQRLRALSQRLEAFTDLQGDGLAPTKDVDYTCVCMSGLGGIAIREILRRSPEAFTKAQCMVLQPNNKERELREFMLSHQWTVEEHIVEDAEVWYEVWRCIPGSPGNVGEQHVAFGLSEPWRCQPREFEAKWRPFMDGIVLALQGLHKSDATATIARKQHFQQQLELLQKYIHRARMWNA